MKNKIIRIVTEASEEQIEIGQIKNNLIKV